MGLITAGSVAVSCNDLGTTAGGEARTISLPGRLTRIRKLRGTVPFQSVALSAPKGRPIPPCGPGHRPGSKSLPHWGSPALKGRDKPTHQA